ncbi:uncharacterized protein MONBRDRAFT_28344 [Monosiga brevicollis MX1]|uniref:Suppressor of forked domain-containing protein n=1 Tax=Monosiga brevicollis TaxID=81824 RepID=A9V7W6_MONBE|nr:uncharacterized protein MONBRDRAFT_28344 [Monosiga brevicollis MX1]EDQ86376.1 predicted protein [Monosiga brevicollis MX1]|eukprot:XP_001748766.1 hypothetical protein [Monosiga brevicollis MX1]
MVATTTTTAVDATASASASAEAAAAAAAAAAVKASAENISAANLLLESKKKKKKKKTRAFKLPRAGDAPVKDWLAYLERKKSASPAVRFSLFERAVRQLPGSFKLWVRYLRERKALVATVAPTDPARRATYDTFRRAMVFMHKMPRIWIEYLELMMESGLITETRRTFDECLRALPITQHHRIWPLYLKFVRQPHIPTETACRVYRRYLMIEPNDAEEFVDYLVSAKRYEEAAAILIEVLNKEKYVSKQGKSHHQLWLELCQLVSEHPDGVRNIKVEPIIRGGLRKFSDMIGQLWCALAAYHIRRGSFEKARDIYEEAIQTVQTVRDFSQVFEAYAEFEEQSLTALMEQMGEEGLDGNEEVEWRMARYEQLMERRPLLLSSVLLRQNPHNVDEWHKRVALFSSQPSEMILTYRDAVKTVDPSKATGKVHTLWVEFARLYEATSLEEARKVYERGVQEPFRKVDDLAELWCQYAEMELRHKNFQRAVNVLRRATAMPSKKQLVDESGRPSVQARVHKSLKLWSMYADLEESIGTLEGTKAVYNRMLELRVATPQVIINFATFLEENKYFEEAFTAYERGVALFKWPIVFEIWNTYLAKFIKRYVSQLHLVQALTQQQSCPLIIYSARPYLCLLGLTQFVRTPLVSRFKIGQGGDKLERTRELFEQCLENIPAKFAKVIYLMYADFEEKYGLGRHAMAVYQRATQKVPSEDRFEMWQLYIKRAAALFGVVYTRELFVAALEDTLLSDKDMQAMAMDFASLETKLGEVDRARAIYSHTSQYCEPKSAKKFWDAWEDFEVRHGNEDTYREMLRIKRSVAAQSNTSSNVNVFRAAEEAARALRDGGNAMAAAESEAAARAAPQQTAFVKAGGAPAGNRDEIDLDDDDDDDEEEDGNATETATNNVDIEEKAVPDEVFGGIGAKALLSQKSA